MFQLGMRWKSTAMGQSNGYMQKGPSKTMLSIVLSLGCLVSLGIGQGSALFYPELFPSIGNGSCFKEIGSIICRSNHLFEKNK
jgi:hypothetical protein